MNQIDQKSFCLVATWWQETIILYYYESERSFEDELLKKLEPFSMSDLYYSPFFN